MIPRNSRRAAVCVALLAMTLSACKYTGFGDPPIASATALGATYLKTQQQPDGGFEVSGFPGFETPDAILAIVQAGQTELGWDKSAARTAVQAVTKNGHSALDWLDDFVDDTSSPISSSQAAKIILLDALPLGYDATAFNPQNDATSKDLVATMDGGLQQNGSYGTFNGTLYAAIADSMLRNSIPAQTLAYIKAAQQPDGGWNFSGNPSDTSDPDDIDTTSLAIAALVAAPVDAHDTALTKGLQFLVDRQQANGSWEAFGDPDPNSTSEAIMAITSAGFDPTVPCWRDSTDPSKVGTAYASPIGWLLSRQITTGPDAGRIQSPADQYGVNTFATSQSLEALGRGWLPARFLGPQSCPPDN